LQPNSTNRLARRLDSTGRPRLRWSDIYREADLYKAAVRLFTKPLFSWRKALFASTDKRDLYDFARSGLHNLAEIHRALTRKSFSFRPAVALHRNFRGKRRTLYIYPWEERLVDLLLYRLLSARLHDWFSKNSYAYRLREFGLDRCQRKIAGIFAATEDPLFVVKRDIASYFPSINHDLLLAQLSVLVEPDDYLFHLLEKCIKFSYLDLGEKLNATQGIAFGTPTACLLANIYLTPLDRRFDALPGLKYFRYADDLLLLAPSRGTIESARACFEAGLMELQLRSKPSHEHNLLLSRAAATAEGFESTGRIRHLGLEFRADGSVRLSRDKCRKICNLFRFAFRRKRAKLARIVDIRKRALFVIEAARHVLEQRVRNVAIIDYYLKHVGDEAQLRLLDRWLAEEVLSLAFGGGHKKSYFRQLPYHSLRAMGLPSLVHRRRQIQHGQIAAPFLVWKRYQAQKSSREMAANPHPQSAGTAAFSPSPEAVAIPSIRGPREREASPVEGPYRSILV
jgi:hypothetical protein